MQGRHTYIVLGTLLATLLGGGSTPPMVRSAFAGDDLGQPLGDPPSGQVLPATPVGTLSGTVSVGTAGGANWTTDLRAMAGPGDSTPTLSISYVSGGYGGLGVCFSLDAGGAITRCHKTLGQDGENAPLTWTSADFFCYGGVRLVLFSGTYGSDEAEYRPQTSATARIIQHGSGTDRDSGFTVYLPDGSVTEYGTLQDPGPHEGGNAATLRAKFGEEEVPLSWGIKRYRDVAGNTRVYDYAGEELAEDRVLTPRDQRVMKIRYGANAQAQADYSREINFFYKDVRELLTLLTQQPNATNASTSWGYVAGMGYRRTQVLTSVQMAGMRAYKLKYEAVPGEIDGVNGDADRVRLKSLQECAIGEEACLPPTTFEWSVGPTGFEPAPLWGFDSQPFYPLPKASELETAQYRRAAIQLTGDFNGDGTADFLVSPERVNAPIEIKPTGWDVWELWSTAKESHEPVKTTIPAWNTFENGYWRSQAGKLEVPGQQGADYHPAPIEHGNTRDPKATESAWSINYDGDARTDVLVGDALTDLANLLGDPPWALGQATTWTRGVNAEAPDSCVLDPIDWFECAKSRTWSGADYHGHPGVMRSFTVWRLTPGTEGKFEKTALGYDDGHAALWATPADLDGNGLDDLVWCRSDIDYAAEAGKPQPMYYRDDEPGRNWLSGRVHYALNEEGSGLDLSQGGVATPRRCHFKDALYVTSLYGDGRQSVLVHGHMNPLLDVAPTTEAMAIIVPLVDVEDPYPADPNNAQLHYYLQKVWQKALAEQALDDVFYDALTWNQAEGLQTKPTNLRFDGFMRWQTPGNTTQRYSSYQSSDFTNIDGGADDLDPKTTYSPGRMTDWGDPGQRLMTGVGRGEMRFMDLNGDRLTDALAVEPEQCYYEQVPPDEDKLPPYQSRPCTAQDVAEFGGNIREQTYEKLKVQTYLNRGDGTFEQGEGVRLWDTDLTVAQEKLLAGITPILSKEDQEAFNAAWSTATSASRGWKLEFGSSSVADPNGNGLADLFFVRADFTPDNGSDGLQMTGSYALTPKYLRVTSGGKFPLIDEAGLDLNKLAPQGGWPAWLRVGTNWLGNLDQIGEVSRYEMHEKGMGLRYVPTDFDEDGIMDMLVYNHVNGMWLFARGISPGVDNPTNGTKAKGTARANLLVAVVDGLGARTEIDYAPQRSLPATGTVWTEADSTLAYPLSRRPSTAPVVSAVRSDTGRDNGKQPDYTTLRYRYGKSTVDVQRGASLGIDKRETWSQEATSSGVVHKRRMERYDTASQYDPAFNAYPLAGTLQSETTMVWQDGGLEESVFLSHSGSAYSAKDGVAEGTWRRQTDASTSTTFEIGDTSPGAQKVYECLIEAFDGASECVLGGSPDYQPLTSAQTLTVYDEYGYPLVSQVSSAGSTTITTVPEYLHQDTLQFGHYALGMAKETWTGNEPRPAAGYTVRTTAFDYYPDGRLAERTVEPGEADYRQREVIKYDAFGNVKKTTLHAEGLPDSWVINDYSPDGVYLEKTTNALGQNTTTRWFKGCGMPEQQTNLLGHTQVNDIDALCRPRSSRSYFGSQPLGPKQTIDYAEEQPDAEEAYPDVELKITTAVEGGATSYTLADRTGKSYYSRTPGFGMQVYTQSVYDRLGREVRTSPPTEVGKNPEGWSEVTLDAQGRTRILTHPDGTQQRTEYRRYAAEKDGVVTYAGAAIACEGCITTEVTTELGHTGKNVSNALGQVVKVIPPQDENDPVDTSMCYSYGAFGALSEARPCVANNVKGPTSLSSDKYGRLTQSEDAQGGKRQTFYNALGQVDHTLDARQITTKYRYDTVGRLVERIEAYGTDEAKSATWTYDPEIGILTEAKNADGTVIEQPTLDGYRRPNGAVVTIHGRSYRSGVGYNDRGLPDETRLPTLDPQHPVTVGTLYNNLDQIIGTTYGDALLWQPLNADAHGHLTKQKYGNGLFARAEYEPLTARLKEATVYREHWDTPDLSWEEPIQVHGYDWNADGTLRIRTRKALFKNQTDQGDEYHYTARGELEGWVTIGANNAVQQNAIKTDGFGNLTWTTRNGDYHYEKERLKFVKGQSLVVYEYDANGNVTQRSENDQVTNLVYNALDRVERIGDSSGDVQITHSADGAKVQTENLKTGRITTYLGAYQEDRGGELGSQVISRYNLGPAQLVRTWSAPLMPMTYTDAPLVYQTPADYLGSLNLITTATGEIEEERSYGTWGEERDPTDFLKAVAPKDDPTAVNLGWTGHERKRHGGNGGQSTGLQDMGARYYDPYTHRMLQADSLIPNVMQPLALNRYTYTYNNPIAFTDPSGNAPAPTANDGETAEQAAKKAEAAKKAAAAERSVADLEATENGMAYAGVSIIGTLSGPGLLLKSSLNDKKNDTYSERVKLMEQYKRLSQKDPSKLTRRERRIMKAASFEIATYRLYKERGATGIVAGRYIENKWYGSCGKTTVGGACSAEKHHEFAKKLLVKILNDLPDPITQDRPDELFAINFKHNGSGFDYELFDGHSRVAKISNLGGDSLIEVDLKDDNVSNAIILTAGLIEMSAVISRTSNIMVNVNFKSQSAANRFIDNFSTLSHYSGLDSNPWQGTIQEGPYEGGVEINLGPRLGPHAP